MPTGRGASDRDPDIAMERARRDLIRELDNADGDDLRRAIAQAKELLFMDPHDDEVDEALARAERRLAGPAAD